MTLEEKHLLLTTARVLHAQFRAAGEPLDERDGADFEALTAALAPFDDDEPAATGIAERNLLFTTAQAVRSQLCQAPRSWEDRDRLPARAMHRALAAAAPPPFDVLGSIDRD